MEVTFNPSDPRPLPFLQKFRTKINKVNRITGLIGALKVQQQDLINRSNFNLFRFDHAKPFYGIRIAQEMKLRIVDHSQSVHNSLKIKKTHQHINMLRISANLRYSTRGLPLGIVQSIIMTANLAKQTNFCSQKQDKNLEWAHQLGRADQKTGKERKQVEKAGLVRKWRWCVRNCFSGREGKERVAEIGAS